MSSPIPDSQRYLRQILLAEVGRPGQAQLSAARWEPDLCAPATAQGVTKTYLARAGVQTSGTQGGDARFDKPFDGAHAALRGAFDAVEFIKKSIGVGTSGTLPPNLFEFGAQ